MAFAGPMMIRSLRSTPAVDEILHLYPLIPDLSDVDCNCACLLGVDAKRLFPFSLRHYTVSAKRVGRCTNNHHFHFLSLPFMVCTNLWTYRAKPRVSLSLHEGLLLCLWLMSALLLLVCLLTVNYRHDRSRFLYAWKVPLPSTLGCY